MNHTDKFRVTHTKNDMNLSNQKQRKYSNSENEFNENKQRFGASCRTKKRQAVGLSRFITFLEILSNSKGS